MSHFERSLRSQFFMTGPRPCPYLPGRMERKLFTTLAPPHAEPLHDRLALIGFRRSQNIAYRPACQGCSACVSTRLCAEDRRETRSERRILRRNADLIRRVRAPIPTDEHYALFRRYLTARHADGGMTDMDAIDFASMIEDSPVRTCLVEYRQAPGSETEKETLLAACVTDVLSDGLSLVYSYFDPEATRRSLGRHIILDHLALAQERRLPYVYLGYWVPGSDKMSYKIAFQPAEILTETGWRPFDPDAEDGAPPPSL